MLGASAVHILLSGLYLRKKIDSIVARGGGVPDRDAPSVLEETKFWCTVEETRVDSTKVEYPDCLIMYMCVWVSC